MNTHADECGSPEEQSRRVVNWLTGHLDDIRSPVAVHAGHFMLLSQGAGCVPSVATHQSTSKPDGENSSIHQALNQFSMETWRMGVGLVSNVRSASQMAGLLTLVNDWQYIRNRNIPNASDVRSAFYKSNTSLFPSYHAVLNEFDLADDTIISVGSWRPFISESWLRRCIKYRLKRLSKAKNSSSSKIFVEYSVDGQSQLFFDDCGQICKLLMCGQADCSGEVMELVFQLYQLGFRQFVNIIPAECEKPVNEGTRRAIALFGFDDFNALNVSIPCLPAINNQKSFIEQTKLYRVHGERIDDDDIDTMVESAELFIQ